MTAGGVRFEKQQDTPRQPLRKSKLEMGFAPGCITAPKCCQQHNSYSAAMPEAVVVANGEPFLPVLWRTASRRSVLLKV